MKRVVAERSAVRADRSSREEARQLFADDPLKLERLDELADDEVITVYRNGPFLDLCRGPHVPSTGRVKNFKLLNTAGAYWRGDEKRQMLQRIYGTAWFSAEDLEAAPTSARRGAQARSPQARHGARTVLLPSVGARCGVLDRPWHHHLPRCLATGCGACLLSNGYQEVKTPLMFNKALWEISGHWGKYRENMFLVLDNETGEHDFSLKPMNCPSHHLLYRHEAALVPRAADALLDAGCAAPQRGVGRAEWPHARAPVRAG